MDFSRTCKAILTHTHTHIVHNFSWLLQFWSNFNFYVLFTWFNTKHDQYDRCVSFKRWWTISINAHRNYQKIIPTKFIHTKRKNYEKKLMATVCVFDDVATTMKFNVNYEKLIYLYEFWRNYHWKYVYKNFQINFRSFYWELFSHYS